MARKGKSAKDARLATLAAQTQKQKAELLVELKKVPIVQTACAKTGVGRSTYYLWRKDDKTFAQEATKALGEGKSLISDMAISQLIKKIQEGNTTSIIFWLKNHHADYSDRVVHEHEHEHHFEFTQEEKDNITRGLRNIGLANILKMNDDLRTVEEWEADNERRQEDRRKELGLSKKPKKPSEKKTLGEMLEEEGEVTKPDTPAEE